MYNQGSARQPPLDRAGGSFVYFSSIVARSPEFPGREYTNFRSALSKFYQSVIRTQIVRI